MSDHYTNAKRGLKAAQNATAHEVKAIAFANAQVLATLAVADLIRQGQQDAHEMFKQTRVDAGLEVDAVTERQLDAETKEVYDTPDNGAPLADIADEILSVLDRVDSSPRVWALPPAPGPAVTAVRDVDGDIWDRVDDGWTSGGCPPRSWQKLVTQFGPLTAVEDGAR